MQHTDKTLLLRFETLALFVFSLIFGFMLLRIRDFLFGEDIKGGGTDHHIDFQKKIEEEEQDNLDEILKTRGCRNLNIIMSTPP